MDYSNLTLIKLMQGKMAYHAERQDVLATNVANIDTPGFQPEDIKQPDFERMVKAETNRLQVRATNSAHITESVSQTSDYRPEKMRDTYETTPVKNSVVLEEQMMNVAMNQMEYQKVTNLYSKVNKLFKTAIGNN